MTVKLEVSEKVGEIVKWFNSVRLRSMRDIIRDALRADIDLLCSLCGVVSENNAGLSAEYRSQLDKAIELYNSIVAENEQLSLRRDSLGDFRVVSVSEEQGQDDLDH
ncbi:MAG: hypothetical protein H0Z39_08830 [Peptococcaceae bacterium]|nr:hypothetical protein [Peptococcaceae bacterium]